MRIAFDLDDTLIPCSHAFEVERPTWLARWLRAEPLRKGTVCLLKHLRAAGWEVWVYTTSLRNPLSVRLHFLAYGVRIQGVINHDGHVRRLRGGRPDHRDCSKYPPAFGLDLLVDDSEGVRLEGRRYHFQVLRLDPRHPDWVNAVLAEAGLLKRGR